MDITPTDLPAWLQGRGYVRIPLQTTSVGLFYTSGTVSGRPVVVLVDTGAGNSVLCRDWAVREGLPLEPTDEKGGGAGAALLEMALLSGAEVTVSGHPVALPLLYALDLSIAAEALRNRGVTETPQLILGMDVLGPRAAVIDYGNPSLYLRSS